MLADPPPDVQESVMRKIGLKYMGDGIYRADETPNDRVEGRAAASSRRVPWNDGLCGNGNYNERTDK